MPALIIETRPRIATSLLRCLEEQLVPARWESDVRVGCQRAHGAEVQAVLLAHEPPLHDGVALTALLRRTGVRAPILLLTRGADVATVRAAFDAGADDILERPFDADELTARVRRYVQRAAQGQNEVLACGLLRYDVTAKRTYVEEKEVQLTPRETMLLQVLLRHRGQVLSRSQIISKVWGSMEVPFANVVDVQILRLRKALGDLGRQLIHTIHGFGYRMGD